MRCLIYVALLALQIVLCTCDEPEVIVSIVGYRLILRAPEPSGKLEKCTLQSNDNTLYEIYPTNKKSPGEYAGRGGNCVIDIRESDINHAGLWTMTTITDDETITTQYKIIMKQSIRVTPTRVVWAYAGQWIEVGLDNNDTDVRSCVVTLPGFKEYELLEEQPEGVSRHGPCGVRMLASESVIGQWELTEQVGEYLINHAMFHIRVPYESYAESSSNPEVLNDTWIIGRKSSVDLYENDVIFCQITRPDGTKMPFKFGKCELNVAAATAYHEGTWQAVYAKAGKVDLLHKDIVIKTRDLTAIECSYSRGTGEEVHLLCKNDNVYLKFCTFIRPDNYKMYLPAGIGNGNYSYYGYGYDSNSPSRDHSECGITIHKPSDVDFGLWACEIGLEDGKIRGSMVNVPSTRVDGSEGENTKITPPVYVKRGDPFMINCKTNAILKYCWVSSPNGTAYSVMAGGGRSSLTLKYDGKGYEMGECGAIVEKSNVSDSGEWICHLGTKGGFEVEQVVPVNVRETYLVPSSDTVYVNKQTKLTCRTFNGDKDTLKYCRWIRPNGQGIGKADASRFKQSEEATTCTLTISDPQPEDVGTWTCFGGLANGVNQEEWATLEVMLEESKAIANVWTIVVGSGLLIATLIGVVFAALYFYRKRNRRISKNPPPYCTHDYDIPSDVGTGAEAIPNKSTKY